LKDKRKGKYRRLSQDEFIQRCLDNQKIELDYSEVVYNTQHDRIYVTCKKHNYRIHVTAQSVSDGCMVCPECLSEYKSSLLLSNKDKFLAKFNDKFPDNTFDFTNSVYSKSSEHMEVICEKGHTFSIKPNNLMSGYGCSKCHHERIGYIFSKTKGQYIEQFINFHGDRYDYSKVTDFKNCKEKVIVICKQHGEFLISPDNHSRGKGCPLCGKKGYQPQSSGYFYILKVTDSVVKFGITNNIDRRLTELKKKSVFDLEIIHLFYFEDGYIPQNIENSVYRDKSIERCVVNRADMKSGYVETTFRDNVTKILEIVNSFTTSPS